MVKIEIGTHLYTLTLAEAWLLVCFDVAWISAVVIWRVKRHKSRSISNGT